VTSPQPSRRRLSASQRRTIILDAAARVFAERGYFDASMIEIAAAAGIAPSVIYDHFPSKQKLHLALLDLHGRAVIAASTRPDRDADPYELMHRSVEAFFAFVEVHPYLWRMLFRDPPADGEIALAHGRIHNHAIKAMAAMIASAPKLSLSAPLPRARANELVALAIKSANDGLAAWWYERPTVPREQIVAVAVDLAWRGLERIVGG
jgi:AcrR family transcriptional regulator